VSAAHSAVCKHACRPQLLLLLCLPPFGCRSDTGRGAPATRSPLELVAIRDCSAADTLRAGTLQEFALGLHHSPRSYTPLSIAAMNALIEATRALDAADLARADAAAATADYRLAPLLVASTCYWLLLPPNFPGPIDHALLIYASNWQRNLLIEAPHARDDHNTDAESALLFGRLGAKALVISGAWRCVQGASSSGCHASAECGPLDRNTGLHRRIDPAESDPSHSIRNTLYAVHFALRTTDTVVLQLHTNFHPDINGDAMVSNGTRYAIPGTSADALYAALQASDIDVRSCNDPERPVQGAFCGETTTESLASNGAADTCLGRPSSNGGAAAHRFIHLEQNSARMCRPDEIAPGDAGAVQVIGPPQSADPAADAGATSETCIDSYEAWAGRIGAALELAIPVTH
jgi:hypothetical protein